MYFKANRFTRTARLYINVCIYIMLCIVGGQAVFKRINGTARKVQQQMKSVITEYNSYADVKAPEAARI